MNSNNIKTKKLAQLRQEYDEVYNDMIIINSLLLTIICATDVIEKIAPKLSYESTAVGAAISVLRTARHEMHNAYQPLYDNCNMLNAQVKALESEMR